MNPPTLLIAGGSGFIGRATTQHFQAKGWNVEWLSRNPNSKSPVKTWYWNPSQGEMDPEAFKQADVVLNLAGLSLADGPWTSRRKREFETSRISALTTLNNHAPNHADLHLISASATGYYGSSPQENKADESNDPGSDFLAQLCLKWESAAQESPISRICIARIGVVFDSHEGAFPVMAKTVRWGLGAVPGTGRQGISWIHIDDVVRGFEWIVEKKLQGVYNFTSPNPVSMLSFMRKAAKKYRRPLWPIFVPEWIVSMLLGEKSVLACRGVYAYPIALTDSGFSFLYPEIDRAIASI